jgi:hypothetical protein
VAAERQGYYGAAVYGSVVAAALTGAMLEAHEDARQMTVTLAGSMIVFWLAHAWSETVGERVDAGRRFDPRRIRGIARAEWPLVESGLLPTLLLAAAWASAWSDHTGIVLALGAAVVQLVGWGIAAGYRTEQDWRMATLVGIGDGLLGLAIVGFEIALH